MTMTKLWKETPRYLKRLIIHFIDHGGNVILNGRVGECISSRVGRNVKEGEWWSVHLFAPVIDFFFGKDHCANNIDEYIKNHD